MKDETELLDGVPLRSEKIEFEPSELVHCEGCSRLNPPNRAECLYCGVALRVRNGLTSPLKIRDVEPWEKAFNIVLIGDGGRGANLDSLPIDSDLVERAITAPPPVPIGRFATAAAADSINQRLKDAELKSVVVADDDLNAGHSPVRLRALCIEDDGFLLTTFNTNERIKFGFALLKLIVVGRLFEERSEQTLKKKRGGVKEIEGRNVSKDSGVVDIYFANEQYGFRILETGFDFSGLGERKSFSAAENIKRLVEQVRTSSSDAIVSTDYVSKRGLLEAVWPSAMRNISRGVQRAKFGVTVEKAEVSSNDEQFTKYSRLVMLTI